MGYQLRDEPLGICCSPSNMKRKVVAENLSGQENEQLNHKYTDMLNLPHPVSESHPRMTIQNRAAQFAPFAALTGYEDAVKEASRLTDEKVDLDENSKELLDEKLQFIGEHLKEQPEISITYFEPDEKKEGGAYRTLTDCVKKIDFYTQTVVLQNGTQIQIKDIMEIS